MKSLLLRVLLTTTVLSPAIAPAELVLYKGSRRDAFNSQGQTLTINWKTFLVVDHDTVQVASLQYGTISGAQRYSTNLWDRVHFVQVPGAKAHYTAIARMPTQCEIDSGATGEAVYCKGIDAALTVSTGTTVTFPKILTDRGSGLGFSDVNGQPYLVAGSFKFVFDSAGTLQSNQAGETFDAALTRLINYVESLGYNP